MRARIAFPKWLRLWAQLYRAQSGFGPASPAALRSARRRTGTPAHIPRPSRARLPLPRPLHHPAGTLAPRARPSASRRPHTHPLRRARWEPLAEAKGTAADPRRPGFRRPLHEASRGAAWASRARQSAGRMPPPPCPPAPGSPATRPSGVRRCPQRSMATRGRVCGASEVKKKKNLPRNTHTNLRYKSARTDDPARYLFPIGSKKC